MWLFVVSFLRRIKIKEPVSSSFGFALSFHFLQGLVAKEEHCKGPAPHSDGGFRHKQSFQRHSQPAAIPNETIGHTRSVTFVPNLQKRFPQEGRQELFQWVIVEQILSKRNIKWLNSNIISPNLSTVVKDIVNKGPRATRKRVC